VNEEIPTFFYNEAQNKLARQFRSIDSLDIKAGVLVGFSSAILVAFLTTWDNMIRSGNHYLYFLSLLVFVISAILALLAFRTGKYRDDPDIRGLYNKYKDKSINQIKDQIIQNLTISLECNQKKTDKKGDFINWSLYAIVVGLILIVVAEVL